MGNGVVSRLFLSPFFYFRLFLSPLSFYLYIYLFMLLEQKSLSRSMEVDGLLGVSALILLLHSLN